LHVCARLKLGIVLPRKVEEQCCKPLTASSDRVHTLAASYSCKCPSVLLPPTLKLNHPGSDTASLYVMIFFQGSQGNRKQAYDTQAPLDGCIAFLSIE
jgi:hypothetical protein